MNKNAIGAKSTAKIRKKSQIAAISAEKSSKPVWPVDAKPIFYDFARPSGWESRFRTIFFEENFVKCNLFVTFAHEISRSRNIQALF